MKHLTLSLGTEGYINMSHDSFFVLAYAPSTLRCVSMAIVTETAELTGRTATAKCPSEWGSPFSFLVSQKETSVALGVVCVDIWGQFSGNYVVAEAPGVRPPVSYWDIQLFVF